MFPKTTGPFTIQWDRSTLEVDTETGWVSNSATLRVDGEIADRQRKELEPVVLTHADVVVTVRWNLTRQVTGCTVRPARTGDTSAEDDEIAEDELVPPEGSHAWKLAALKRDRPGLYASRHVAIAVLQTVIGLLGIGALVFGFVRGVLPNVDLPNIPLPNIENPPPDWLRYLLRWQWLVDLVRASPLDFQFDLSWPNWGDDVLRAARWIVPILIALAVAIEEYVRRTSRTPDNRKEPSDDDASPEDIRVTNTVAGEPVPNVPTQSESSEEEPDNADQGPNERPKAGEAARPAPPQE